MKKFFKQCLSVLLVVITIFSMTTMGLTSFSAAETQTVSTGLTGSGLADAALKRVGGRLFAEFTSYCISNKVPVLGSAFYVLFCDPATRSTIKMQGQVSEIYSDVKEIKQDINSIMDDLDTIYKEIVEIDKENKYITAKKEIQKYCIDDAGTLGYQILWMKYETVLENYNKAEECRSALKDETDPSERAKLEKDITSNEEAAKNAMNDFVYFYQTIFFGKKDDNKDDNKDYNYDSTIFERDMNNINDCICSENKGMEEFLPALENMLRVKFDYEHQITDIMLAGFEYCEAVQYQMYLIHREYASYCEAMKYAGSSFDEIPELPEDFFKTENELFQANVEEQILNSGIYTLIVSSTLDEAEATLETAPFEFETTVKINGQDTPCYIIRDNKDLSYYVVTKESKQVSQLVSHREEQWDNLTHVNYYQPDGMFNSQYTDDGEFRMISSLSEVSNLSETPLASFINADMDISQSAKYILLYNYDCVGLDKDEVLWNMKFASAAEYNKNEPEEKVNTFTSKEAYSGSEKNEEFIRIYKSVFNDELFNNDQNKLVIKERTSMPKLIALHDGQVLDYSKVEVSPEGCTIILTGKATVIGNPDVPLTDSQIIVCTDKQVTLKNINVNAIKYKSAIEVKCSGAKIAFEGVNTFTGNGEAVDLNKMTELDTNNHNPVGVSHGMLINKGADVTLTGATATFNGDAGGAGICTWGNLVIDNATIIANGSYEKLDSYFEGYEEFKTPVYSIGAGIGASVSAVKNSKNSTVYLSEDLILGRTYSNYGTITIKNNSDITAKGAYPEGDKSGSYASDIGGARFVTHIDYENVLGWIITDVSFTYDSKSVGGGNISDSKVLTYKGVIGGNIKLSNNDYDYVMDTYTITTSTAGSSGVTDDKLSFTLIGDKGTTNGTISSSNCGNKKGQYTMTFNNGYIGTELSAIEIEIDGDDGWYPEYINVKSENGKINQTLYGGRWLDNSGTITLKPTDNVFKIGITTSNDTNAGTDAAVYVQLVDQNGITSDKINASDVHPESNAFEKGDSMSLYMYAPDKFGKLQYIQINSDANGTAAANWKIEKLDAAQMSGGNKDDNFSITVNQWDPNGVTMSFGRETGKSGTFEFLIKTQNVTGAGTDATIKFKLIGTNGETNLVDVESFIDNYTSGDNFEKNDKDTGRITFKMPKGGIGTITGLYVESSGGAASADWDLEYVEITEILPDGEGQHVKFNAKCTIKKKSNKTLTNPSIVVKTVSPSINREILENLKMTDENSYLLSVNEPVTISYDVFKLLKDNGIDLTVEMLEGTDVLYSITFDGKEIKNFHDVTLGKNYEIRDGETLVNFLENSYIPEGTTINLYLDKLGFTENSVVSIYVKDENGNWSKIDTELSEGEIYHEIEITDGSDFILRSESTSVSGTDENTPVDKDVVSTGNTGMVVFVTLTFAVMGCLTLVGFSMSRKKKEQ